MPSSLRAVLLTATAVVSLAVTTAPADAVAAAPAKHYKNCTALNKVYRHGVGKRGAHDHVSGHTKPVTNFTRNNAVYTANKGSDRDHDGIACEKR